MQIRPWKNNICGVLLLPEKSSPGRKHMKLSKSQHHHTQQQLEHKAAAYLQETIVD
jgi:hypothetical protein